MATVDDTLDQDDYDEFGLLHENAEEWDLPFEGRPEIRRGSVATDSGGRISYLQWGTAEPEWVLLHGGGQNAHTWDTLLLTLGRPVVAFDLPGHGRSDRRDDKDYGPWANATAVAEALDQVAPGTRGLIGMSLGGATAIRLAAERPDLVSRLVLIDVTPQINDPSREMSTMEKGSVALIGGPPTYDSFEEMAEATIALSPHRAASGVRRGVRHNAYRRADGRWTWRYDLFGPWPEGGPQFFDFTPLWDDVSRIGAPVLLVRGGESRYVRDEDVEELQRRRPDARVETVPGAGHAVQSDRPLDLVRLLQA